MQQTYYEVHVMEGGKWVNAIPMPRSKKAAIALAEKIVAIGHGQHIKVLQFTHREDLIKSYNRPVKG